MTPFEKKVYEITKKIPRGRVATYQVLARALGKPRAARAVGSALKRNPFAKVPCHRVVRSDCLVGGYARGGTRAKIEILRREGVNITRQKVEQDFFMDP